MYYKVLLLISLLSITQINGTLLIHQKLLFLQDHLETLDKIKRTLLVFIDLFILILRYKVLSMMAEHLTNKGQKLHNVRVTNGLTDVAGHKGDHELLALAALVARLGHGVPVVGWVGVRVDRLSAAYL